MIDADALRNKIEQELRGKPAAAKPKAKPDSDFNTEYESKSGEVMFSDIFYEPKFLPDFPIVIDRSFSAWAEQFIPDVENYKHWVWAPETEFVVHNLIHGMKSRLVGPPGCGKTEIGGAICAFLGIPYYHVSMNRGVEICDLAGKTNLRSGETVFVESDLIRMYRETGARMIQVNELSRMRADAAMFFQPAWDNTRCLFLQEKEEDNVVHEGPGLMWLSTDNTLGLGDNLDKYAAANVLDGSTLDRWDTTYQWNYLTPEEERKLVSTWAPSLSVSLSKRLVQLANLCRDAFDKGELSIPVSPRHLRSMARLTEEWRNPVHAIRAVVINAVPDEEKDTVRKFIMTIGFDESYGKV